MKFTRCFCLMEAHDIEVTGIFMRKKLFTNLNFETLRFLISKELSLNLKKYLSKLKNETQFDVLID